MARVIFRRYEPDTASMAAFLMSGDVNRVAMSAGRDIARDARQNMIPFSRTGGTAEGYEVEPSVGRPSTPGDMNFPRRAATVYNNDPGAAANEFGYKNTPERRPLRNAAEPYHVPRIVRSSGGWGR